MIIINQTLCNRRDSKTVRWTDWEGVWSFAFSVLAHRHMRSFGRSATPDEDRASPYTNGNRIQYKAATCRIKLSVEDNSIYVQYTCEFESLSRV